MFAIQMAGKLVGIADYWLVQWMLGGQLNLVEAAFIVSGSQVVSIVLSISPVQIGIGEAGETALWALTGLPVDLGFAQAFVRRLRGLMFNFAGLLYLGFEGTRRTREATGPS